MRVVTFLFTDIEGSCRFSPATSFADTAELRIWRAVSRLSRRLVSRNDSIPMRPTTDWTDVLVAHHARGGHVIASAVAICPSKASDVAMAR
jgi:hypothetical protein